MTAAFLLAAATLLPAAGPAPPAKNVTPLPISAERVAALVESLSAPSRAERARAERDLVALGPAAADLLPAPGSPAAPTGAAALAALERIRTALAAAPEPAPGPARLRPADLPRGKLAETLEAIAERTGNRLDPSALPPETRSAPAPDLSPVAGEDGTATFWETLNALAPGRFAVGNAADGALRLLPPTDAPPAVTSAGLLRIEVGRPAVRPRFGADGTLWRLPVRMIAEPRVRPLSARPIEGGLTAAVGETPLAPFNPAASREIGFAEGAATFNVDFLPPPDSPAPAEPAPLAVSGRYELVSIPGDRAFQFTSSETGETRSAGGAAVRLDGLERTTDGVTVTAAVLYDADGGGPAFESYQTWHYGVRVRLLGPNGEIIAPAVAPRIVAEGAAAVGVKAQFTLPPAADLSESQVEITAPAAPVTTAVRFEGLSL